MEIRGRMSLNFYSKCEPPKPLQAKEMERRIKRLMIISTKKKGHRVFTSPKGDFRELGTEAEKYVNPAEWVCVAGGEMK